MQKKKTRGLWCMKGERRCPSTCRDPLLFFLFLFLKNIRWPPKSSQIAYTSEDEKRASGNFMALRLLCRGIRARGSLCPALSVNNETTGSKKIVTGRDKIQIKQTKWKESKEQGDPRSHRFGDQPLLYRVAVIWRTNCSQILSSLFELWDYIRICIL